MSRVVLPDGGEAIIADFALESTAQMMLAQLGKLNGGNFEKLVEHAKQAAKDQDAFLKSTKKFQEELLSETKELVDEVEKSGKKAPGNLPSVAGNTGGNTAGSVGKAADAAATSLDGFNKGAATGEKIFANMYAVSASAIKGTITAITVYGGILIDTFVGLGSELNEMTKLGVGFTDGVGQGGMSATSAMMSLSSMGIDAAGTLKNLSGVVQTMSKKSFTDFTQSFMDATDSGVELGMSLDDSVERMGAELQKRQAMGVADGMNQARMNAQITRTIKTQQKYASVLGESVDNIVAFTDSLIQQTPVLTSSLLRFDKELRGKVISGITDFAGTMRAMGGEEGGNIAAAMTEAAASGGLGFSDSMKGYVTALPSLQGPMNDYIKQIKNGTLSQEDAEQMATDMTSQLGNLSKAEKDRIFMLDRAGNAQAASMAKAIMQFEASAKKLKDLGPDLSMEGVQKGTNTLAKIMKQITGSFEGIKTGFLQGFGNITEGGKGLSDTFNKMKNTVMDSISIAMGKFGLVGGVFDEMSGAGISLGEQLGKKLPKILETFAEYVGMAIEALPGIWEGIKSFVSGVSTVFGILSTAVSIAMLPIRFIGGVIEGVGATLKLGWDLIVGVFKLVGAVGGALVDLVMMPFRAVGDSISTAGAMITAPFAFFGNLMGGIFDKISGVFSFFGDKLSPLFDAVSMPFDWLGKTLSPTFDKIVAPFSYLGDKIKSFAEVFTGGGLVSTLGKVAGAAGVLLVTTKALGVGMPKMLSGLADKITGGAKKIAGGLKDKVMGKKASADVGGMDKVGKKAGSLTKSIGKGMSNISKGIGDMLKNISKGIGSVITNLAKAVGKAGASLGKGLGDMVGGALKGLGKGLAALGNPKALLGTVVLAALGASMFIAGKAFQQFAGIDWKGVGLGMLALGALGVAAFLIAPIAPIIAIGALAIGALGLALVPFAYAVSLAAPAMVELMGSFKLLNGVDAKNVALMGPALVSLAVGMAAFSAGGLVGGILDGIGSMLGSDSPFEKLAKIGDAAPAINEMTGNMKGFGSTVETFNDAMTQIDGAAISGEFAKMAEGIDTLNASMAEISLVSLMKMAAMKSFGPVQQDPAEAEVETTAPTTATAPTAGTTTSYSSMDYSDDEFEASPAKVDKEAVTSKVDRSPAGRAKRRAAELRAKVAQIPDNGTGTKSGTFVNGKYVSPIAAKTTQPAQASVTIPKPVLPTDATKLNEAGESTAKPETNKELFERMVKNQEQTNKLLKSGNRITSDLSDEF